MKKSIAVPLTFLFATLLMPYESHAVPSYARQVKKPCTACHTVWANLSQYGRQFKVKAYTDVNQDWEMINKDNLNLSTVFPFSVRVVMEPLTTENNDNAGVHQNSTDVNQVAIFMASRIYDYAGIFTSAEADGAGGTFSMPTVKVAFEYPLGEGNTVGLVAFQGLASSADPFNSLGGRDRDLSFDDGTPFILNTGWTFNFWSGNSLGEVLHGYFLGNRLYAAVGVMRGGDAADGMEGLTNNVNSDPNDAYARVAWDQKLDNGAITVGVANYSGTQRILSGGVPQYDSKVQRTYADVSLEQNFGEDHLVEVQALYGSGKDDNVLGNGESGKYNGSYAQADYYYDRTFGVIASLNNITYTSTVAATDPAKKDSWLVGLNYLPWLNSKVALQYCSTKTTNQDGTNNTDTISRVILDLLF